MWEAAKAWLAVTNAMAVMANLAVCMNFVPCWVSIIFDVARRCLDARHVPPPILIVAFGA
jgi:hypothetical protein